MIHSLLRVFFCFVLVVLYPVSKRDQIHSVIYLSSTQDTDRKKCDYCTIGFLVSKNVKDLSSLCCPALSLSGHTSDSQPNTRMAPSRVRTSTKAQRSPLFQSRLYVAVWQLKKRLPPIKTHFKSTSSVFLLGSTSNCTLHVHCARLHVNTTIHQVRELFPHRNVKTHLVV